MYHPNIRMSAILPNYNSSQFLPQSIPSLLNQSEAFDEIIIVDDGSTDDSLALIQSYIKNNATLRLVKHDKNQGVAAALNSGIQAATGDYIILCAADDTYNLKMVALAKEMLKQFPNVGLVCGDAIVKRFDKAAPFRRMLPYATHTLITPRAFISLSQQHYVGFNGGGGMFMHREAVLKAGMLYPQLRWHCDWMLYFVIALSQGFCYINAIFVYIDMREASYAEGKREWKIQKQVMIDTVDLIQQRYAELAPHFKTAALLPHYSLRYIPLFLFNARLRSFFSMQLLWKCLINNAMVIRIGRLFPYRIILSARKWLKA